MTISWWIRYLGGCLSNSILAVDFLSLCSSNLDDFIFFAALYLWSRNIYVFVFPDKDSKLRENVWWNNLFKYLLFRRRSLVWFLGHQDRMDERQNSSLWNGDAFQQLIQLFIIADGQMQMTRNDALLLVVSSSVTSKFHNFSHQVFQGCCKINWGAWKQKFRFEFLITKVCKC